MKTVSTVVINKPVNEVWAFFDNPNNMDKWLTGFRLFEPISGEPGQPGAVALHYYEENGREFQMKETILTKIENKEFTGMLTANAMKSHINNQFVDLGDGRTKLTFEVETEFKTLFYRMISRFINKSFQKRQDNDLQKLKELVEAL